MLPLHYPSIFRRKIDVEKTLRNATKGSVLVFSTQTMPIKIDVEKTLRNATKGSVLVFSPQTMPIKIDTSKALMNPTYGRILSFEAQILLFKLASLFCPKGQSNIVLTITPAAIKILYQNDLLFNFFHRRPSSLPWPRYPLTKLSG